MSRRAPQLDPNSPLSPHSSHATGVAHVSHRRILTGRCASRRAASRAIAVAALRRLHALDAPTTGGGAMQSGRLTVAAPSPDPRVGLKAGLWDAGQAAVEHPPRLERPSRREKFVGATNSDLAFIGPYVIQGSYNGYQVWDISNPAHPTLKVGVLSARRRRATCRSTRTCCSCRPRHRRRDRLRRAGRATAGEQGAHSRHPHLRHHRHRESEVRRQRADVPRIAHAHACSSIRRTRTTSTSTSRDRPASASAAGAARAARALSPSKDPNSPLFRIEVIKVPLAHPEQAAIVSSPRIFNDLAEAADARATAGRRGSRWRRSARRRRSSSTIFGDDDPRCRPSSRSRCSTAS